VNDPATDYRHRSPQNQKRISRIGEGKRHGRNINEEALREIFDEELTGFPAPAIIITSASFHGSSLARVGLGPGMFFEHD
jgi:hypothetical protein